MGNNSSNANYDFNSRLAQLPSNRVTRTVHPDSIEGKALLNFNQRTQAYNYQMHGPYHDYMEWCQGQYELECIPESCRRGSRYNRY